MSWEAGQLNNFYLNSTCDTAVDNRPVFCSGPRVNNRMVNWVYSFTPILRIYTTTTVKSSVVYVYLAIHWSSKILVSGDGSTLARK